MQSSSNALATTPPQEQVSMAELVQLCAVDNDLYAHTFFPKTARQASPQFHREMDKKLDGPDRYVAFMIFRDGAKTTKIRLFFSKRIAYGMSRTIVVVGKSQDHAIKTVSWLKKQVEWNRAWADTFQLQKGKKWSDVEIEILHGVEGITISIIALGITGSTRGINIDDYRPDLILIDDPSDEENTATPEQREKTDNFINGSLRNSLAPASEAPHAKMVFTQTLLHPEDSISKCEKDPLWAFLKVSCFDSRGESVWPERYPTEVLLKEKESFVARGKLFLWMREKECTIVGAEQAAFQKHLVQWYDLPPERMVTFLGVDPVPPPSDKELQKGLKGKDNEAIAAVGKWGRKILVLEVRSNKGHDPSWTIATLFEMKQAWNPIQIAVESIAYQRTLKWLVQKAMAQRGEWVQVVDTSGPDGKSDTRKKIYRIIDVIGSLLADRRLYLKRDQTDVITQLELYPNVAHEDELEAVSIACNAAIHHGGLYEGEYEDITEAERDIPSLVYEGGCP